MNFVDRFYRFFKKASIYHRTFLDFTVKHIYWRWAYFTFIFFPFWFHIIFHGTHYVIAYIFLTPLSFDDLCAAHEDANNGTILPLGEQEASNSAKIRKIGIHTKDNVYEFKPFLRQMNEFTFWLSAVRVTYIASICLWFDFLDIEVYWPLLILYFVLLFVTTMNQQIRNMIKYKYIPFNFSKKSYRSFKLGK